MVSVCLCKGEWAALLQSTLVGRYVSFIAHHDAILSLWQVVRGGMVCSYGQFRVRSHVCSAVLRQAEECILFHIRWEFWICLRPPVFNWFWNDTRDSELVSDRSDHVGLFGFMFQNNDKYKPHLLVGYPIVVETDRCGCPDTLHCNIYICVRRHITIISIKLCLHLPGLCQDIVTAFSATSDVKGKSNQVVLDF